MQVDSELLFTSTISGIFGLIIGIIGSWVTYRFNLKQDEVRWKRETEEKARILEQEQREKVVKQIREDLTRDIRNPQLIRQLMEDIRTRRGVLQSNQSPMEFIETVNAVTDLIISNIDKKEGKR